MTTTRNVRPRLTTKSLIARLRCHRPSASAPDVERRIQAHADQARMDRIELLIDTWAEVQTEALMRDLLCTGLPWMALRMETTR